MLASSSDSELVCFFEGIFGLHNIYMTSMHVMSSLSMFDVQGRYVAQHTVCTVLVAQVPSMKYQKGHCNNTVDQFGLLFPFTYNGKHFSCDQNKLAKGEI